MLMQIVDELFKMILFEVIFGSTSVFIFLWVRKIFFWYSLTCPEIDAASPLTATAQSSFCSWHTFKLLVCKWFVRTGYTSLSVPFTAWPQMKQWFRNLNNCDWDRKFGVSVVHLIFFSRWAFWISCGLVYTPLYSLWTCCPACIFKLSPLSLLAFKIPLLLFSPISLRDMLLQGSSWQLAHFPYWPLEMLNRPSNF